MVMQNRITLSPLCQYSAEDGHYTMWSVYSPSISAFQVDLWSDPNIAGI